MAREVAVPEMVRRKALNDGGASQRWLLGLGSLLEELEDRWSVSVGEPLDGGTASFVALVTTADGIPAVLKLAMPSEFNGRDALDLEVRVLRQANGRGCVRLMNYDAERRALLLERLGRQLVGLGAPVVEQMEIICALLGQLWSVPADGVPLPTLDEKGRWLVAFIAQSWEELNRPCPTAVVERALTYGERRLASFDASRAVLAHGDAHAWNTLEDLVPTQPGAFRLIDPDGLLAEPEYDLSILLREFTEELLAGDALTLGRARARYLATHTGLSEQKIWEWGYIERVANGLLCLKEGHVDLGRECLHVAELWNQVD